MVNDDFLLVENIWIFFSLELTCLTKKSFKLGHKFCVLGLAYLQIYFP